MKRRKENEDEPPRHIWSAGYVVEYGYDLLRKKKRG